MLYTTTPSTGYRFLSMLIDFLIFSISMWILSMIFIFPAMSMSNMAEMMEPGHEPPTFNFFPNSYTYFLGAVYALYFCKDSFNGKSPGKRILKMQVLNYKTKLPASPLRCIIRNLFTIFWPIEFIVALANPDRRVGDYVAGTEVVSFEEILSPDDEYEYIPAPSPKYLQAISAYIVTGLLISFFVFQWTSFIAKKMQPESLVPFVISSYNKDASAQLQTQLESNFSEMLTSDVRIYDKMKKDENEQYVSVILYVDKPLSITQKELYDSVINLVQSIGVSDTVHGKVQYVVPAPPKLQMKHMVQYTWTF